MYNDKTIENLLLVYNGYPMLSFRAYVQEIFERAVKTPERAPLSHCA